jgi:hypothetical protein
VLLLLALLVLLGMSFLRINNLEHDVAVLNREVERLKAAGAPTATPGAKAVAPTLAAPPDALPHPPSSTTPSPAPAATVPPAAAPLATFDAVPRGFLDENAEVQSVALPAGVRPARARVTILAIEGDGSGERPLPDPIAFTLQAGVPQEVRGICQGPDDAAWIFQLDGSTLRVTSRGCEYPVRGLRPRLRISAAP